jgi:hypothetical protein
VELPVWITRQEAISIYARYFRVRFGVTARNMAVERAHQLKRKGDIEGHQVWNEVAHEIERLTG